MSSRAVVLLASRALYTIYIYTFNTCAQLESRLELSAVLKSMLTEIDINEWSS